jgi:acetyl esterase/lipase
LTADYRLASRDTRFPSALDDAHAAYEWMVARRRAPSQLVVAGDSAGAGLALALLLRLRDAGLPLPAGATAVLSHRRPPKPRRSCRAKTI